MLLSKNSNIVSRTAVWKVGAVRVRGRGAAT